MRRQPLGWTEAGHFQELRYLVSSRPELQFKGMARKQPAADTGRRLPSHTRPIDFAILLSLRSFSEI